MARGRFTDPIIKLLDKEAEMNEPDNRRKRANLMRALDRKLRAEQEKTKVRGYCPKCHLALLTTGKCPFGHQFLGGR